MKLLLLCQIFIFTLSSVAFAQTTPYPIKVKEYSLADSFDSETGRELNASEKLRSARALRETGFPINFVSFSSSDNQVLILQYKDADRRKLIRWVKFESHEGASAFKNLLLNGRVSSIAFPIEGNPLEHIDSKEVLVEFKNR